MKKFASTILICLSTFIVSSAYDYTDDIYYNPKNENKTTNDNSRSSSNYVDFENMSVDDYNNRGYYYTSPIDTIGSYIENEPDFIYTTQIQKYYNPTIVIDNADVLDDVLNNSYGNIEVVYNYNGAPLFVPGSYYGWNWPYYSWIYNNYYNPWSWSVNIGPLSIGWGNPYWGWNWNWNWGWGGPSWNWGWRPSWAWNRPGPGWGPHPGHGPGWNRPGPRPPMATYSPGGRAPFGGQHNGPGGYHAGNYNGNNGARPGGNFGPARKPVANSVPNGNLSPGNSGRPSFNSSGRIQGSGMNNNVRPNNTQTRPAQSNGTRPARTSRPKASTSSTTSNIGSRPPVTVSRPDKTGDNNASGLPSFGTIGRSRNTPGNVGIEKGKTQASRPSQSVNAQPASSSRPSANISHGSYAPSGNGNNQNISKGNKDFNSPSLGTAGRSQLSPGTAGGVNSNNQVNRSSQSSNTNSRVTSRTSSASPNVSSAPTSAGNRANNSIGNRNQVESSRTTNNASKASENRNNTVNSSSHSNTVRQPSGARSSGGNTVRNSSGSRPQGGFSEGGRSSGGFSGGGRSSGGFSGGSRSSGGHSGGGRGGRR